METAKVTYFENAKQKHHQEFIIAQCNCVLCGTVLELKHICDRSVSEVQEEAFCPTCELKARSKKHSLN